jgi:hypothetical protein
LVANSGFGGVNGGNITLTANGGSGSAGLFGEIDLVANSGSASGVITGGKINLIANSGGVGATSAVNLNAGGITSQAGYTSIIGSVAGYNFIGGNSGVNICGGLPSVIPNVAGTTYIYGTTGVQIGSDTYLTRVFPYQYGALNAADMLISGRELDIGLGNHIAYVNISTCKSISFGGSTDPAIFGQIERLSTINGVSVSAFTSGVGSLNSLQGAVTISAGSNITINTIGQDISINAPGASLPYILTGTTAGAVIVNRPIGSGNALPQNIFTLVSQITFNIPPGWTATDSVFYDGWNLSDFDANFNSYWGISYITNTFTTPTDILGSTTVVTNALQYTNIQQVYLPTNLIIPPTNLTAGGTITLSIYCNPTSANHYLTIVPINQARIGRAKD